MIKKMITGLVLSSITAFALNNTQSVNNEEAIVDTTKNIVAKVDKKEISQFEVEYVMKKKFSDLEKNEINDLIDKYLNNYLLIVEVAKKHEFFNTKHFEIINNMITNETILNFYTNIKTKKIMEDLDKQTLKDLYELSKEQFKDPNTNEIAPYEEVKKELFDILLQELLVNDLKRKAEDIKNDIEIIKVYQ